MIEFEDQYRLRNKVFAITASEFSLPMTPEEQALVLPECAAPGLGRGCFRTYGLRNGDITLEAIHVMGIDEYPVLGGVKASAYHEDFFLGAMRIYRPINETVPYTGSFFIGRKADPYLPLTGGKRPWYGYKEAYLLTFKCGELIRARDFRDDMERIRWRVKSEWNNDNADKTQYIINWGLSRIDIRG